MRQILHIFSKRCTALLAICRRGAGAYRDFGVSRSSNYALLSRMVGEHLVDTIHLLLPLAWWFTIAAVVHDETPRATGSSGSRRPYSWRALWPQGSLRSGVPDGAVFRRPIASCFRLKASRRPD